jgi:hypothetical protein
MYVCKMKEKKTKNDLFFNAACLYMCFENKTLYASPYRVIIQFVHVRSENNNNNIYIYT